MGADAGNDAATTVALFTAALALAGTFGTALFALIGSWIERRSTWRAYKRGVYKRLLDVIDQCAVAEATSADAEDTTGVPADLKARYRSRYVQTMLAASPAVLRQLDKLAIDEPRVGRERASLDSEEVKRLAWAMQTDVLPSFIQRRRRRSLEPDTE